MVSFREALCTDARDELCTTIARSLLVLDLEPECYNKLVALSTKGNMVAKNYIILFGIVRLAGLFEELARHSGHTSIEGAKDLYIALNEHLVGANEKPTDVHDFVCEWTARMDWLGN